MRLGALLGGLGVLAVGCGTLVRLEPAPPDEPPPPSGCETAADCDDGLACTEELCVDGACDAVLHDELCAPAEVCDAGQGCVPRQACVTADDCPERSPCEIPQCRDGLCESRRDDAACDDGIDCTDDVCARSGCRNRPQDERCEDGDPCNGDGVCDRESGGCRQTGFPCDDGAECTEDSCIARADGHQCLSLPDHGRCAPGELCTQPDPNGPWTCAPLPCPPRGCDDGIPCNGAETCGPDGFCVGGPGQACDDGLRCTGDEYCDELGQCQRQPAPSCDDGVDCTVDSCDPGIDDCAHAPVDVACSDADACAVPVCEPGGCQGVPRACDDGNDCTIDACEQDAGGCFGVPVDADGDGFGDARCAPAPGDCDDDRAEIHPGADELCNGRDDDCDGQVDDGLCVQDQFQPCQRFAGCSGYQVCDSNCTYGACLALAEECGDAIDNDCNGQIDENCGCENGDQDCIAPCGAPGVRTCDEGTWGPCVPGPELCNGFDDDCNGSVDEGFECALGSVDRCDPAGQAGCGPVGIQVCQNDCTFGACVAPLEICDGFDDDCDGTIDEGFGCVAGSVLACDTGCGGAPGTESCNDQCFLGLCVPPAESCNGADDDCDLLCDNGFACCAGRTSVCQTSCNSGGSSLCDANCTAGSCEAPAEVCNGIDDDCSGACDDGEQCCALVDDAACTTAGGVPGRQVCDAACGWGPCCSDEEVCGNGVDDDCDNQVDPALDCCILSVDEDVCNGLDDNCDGVRDEPFECALGAIDACLVPGCNVIGQRLCEAGCTWGVCAPPVGHERGARCRNGVDDDCDGSVDSDDADCPIVLGN